MSQDAPGPAEFQASSPLSRGCSRTALPTLILTRVLTLTTHNSVHLTSTHTLSHDTGSIPPQHIRQSLQEMALTSRTQHGDLSGRGQAASWSPGCPCHTPDLRGCFQRSAVAQTEDSYGFTFHVLTKSHLCAKLQFHPTVVCVSAGNPGIAR